jgi:hypothetical protein
MAAVIVAFEVCRRGFPAQITVNALVIHIEVACDVLSVSVRKVSHDEGLF